MEALGPGCLGSFFDLIFSCNVWEEFWWVLANSAILCYSGLLGCFMADLGKIFAGAACCLLPAVVRFYLLLLMWPAIPAHSRMLSLASVPTSQVASADQRSSCDQKHSSGD